MNFEIPNRFENNRDFKRCINYDEPCTRTTSMTTRTLPKVLFWVFDTTQTTCIVSKTQKGTFGKVRVVREVVRVVANTHKRTFGKVPVVIEVVCRLVLQTKKLKQIEYKHNILGTTHYYFEIAFLSWYDEGRGS